MGSCADEPDDPPPADAVSAREPATTSGPGLPVTGSAEPREITLYDTAGVLARLEAMTAALAVEVLRGVDPVLVGVRRRGVPLARMLNDRLASRFELGPLPEVELTVKRYADDLTLLHPQTLLADDAATRDLDLSGRTAIVVDDVLYQGHSLIRVVDYLRGRAVCAVRTAVLVDRNVASLPVHADIVGMVLQVAPEQVIECWVPPYEPVLAVRLRLAAGR